MKKANVHKILLTIAIGVLIIAVFRGWWVAVGMIVFLIAIVLVYGIFTMSFGLFIASRCRGVISEKKVALTFDDGPVEGNTELVLEILKKNGITATFFCIGNKVLQYPALVKRMQDDGHLIGNHSHTHTPMFTLALGKKVRRELGFSAQAIQSATGMNVRFFRPPYGITNPIIASAIRDLDLLSIGWSVRSYDTVSTDRKRLLERITKGLKGGDIILLHDRCDITVSILPELIDKIESSGFKIARLDEILCESPYSK